MKKRKEISDKRLFLRYGVTCADSAIENGYIKKGDVQQILDYVVYGIEPDRDYTHAFPMAWTQMSLLAERENQKTIGSKIIRMYFDYKHNDIVDKINAMGKNADACRTYAAVVRKIGKRKATVETVAGVRSCWYRLEPKIELEDYVIIHRGSIVERISKTRAKRLWKQNAKYAKK